MTRLDCQAIFSFASKIIKEKSKNVFVVFERRKIVANKLDLGNFNFTNINSCQILVYFSWNSFFREHFQIEKNSVVDSIYRLSVIIKQT